MRDSRLLNDDYGVFHDSEQESSHQEEAKVDEKNLFPMGSRSTVLWKYCLGLVL